MIKIQNNNALREPIPQFLQGLSQQSLLDLSWTDPNLGVQDCAWYPEEDQTEPLSEYQRYSDETFTIDQERKVVIVKRSIVSWSDEEISQDKVSKANALQDAIVQQVQRRLDDFAKTRNYDGILSLCTYATDTNPTFAAEGQYGVNARSATWAKLYEILAEINNRTRPIPSGYDDIKDELPELVWPS